MILPMDIFSDTSIFSSPAFVMAAGTSALVLCLNCNLTFSVFCGIFIRHIERLVDLCQWHGVLPLTPKCPTCCKSCRVDVNRA